MVGALVFAGFLDCDDVKWLLDDSNDCFVSFGVAVERRNLLSFFDERESDWAVFDLFMELLQGACNRLCCMWIALE